MRILTFRHRKFANYEVLLVFAIFPCSDRVQRLSKNPVQRWNGYYEGETANFG